GHGVDGQAQRPAGGLERRARGLDSGHAQPAGAGLRAHASEPRQPALEPSARRVAAGDSGARGSDTGRTSGRDRRAASLRPDLADLAGRSPLPHRVEEPNAKETTATRGRSRPASPSWKSFGARSTDSCGRNASFRRGLKTTSRTRPRDRARAKTATDRPAVSP